MSAPTVFLSDRLAPPRRCKTAPPPPPPGGDVERKEGSSSSASTRRSTARLAELEAVYAAEAHDLKEAIAQEEGRLQGVLVGRTALASDRQRTAKGGRR